MASPAGRVGDPRKALRAGLLSLQKAERHADGGGQQALGAASDVAVAAVRLMLQAPADGARQRAGLEALKLVTAVKARCAAALDAGAAPVVQRAVATFADDAAIVDLGRVVAQRLLGAENLGPSPPPLDVGALTDDGEMLSLGGASSLSSGDAIKRPTRGSSTRLERRVQQDAALFRSYAVSEDNARRLLEMFPGDDEPRRSRARATATATATPTRARAGERRRRHQSPERRAPSPGQRQHDFAASFVQSMEPPRSPEGSYAAEPPRTPMGDARPIRRSRRRSLGARVGSSTLVSTVKTASLESAAPTRAAAAAGAYAEAPAPSEDAPPPMIHTARRGVADAGSRKRPRRGDDARPRTADERPRTADAATPPPGRLAGVDVDELLGAPRDKAILARRRARPEHELALLENRSVGTRVTFDGESLSQSAAHETVSLEEQKTLEGSEASPFPSRAVPERFRLHAAGAEHDRGDARGRRRRRRRRGHGARLDRGALARTGGELVDDPVVEDEEARLRARRRDFTVMGTARNEAALRAGDAAVQGHVLLKNDDVSGVGPLGRSPAKQERPGPALDPIVVKPSEANRLNHASAVIREQSKVAAAARARVIIADARAPRTNRRRAAAAGAHLVHATHDGTANGALKVADPMPLYDLLRLLDPKERGYCKASEFKAAIAARAGNALSDKEIDHLAGHYAIGGGHAEDEEPDERLGLRTEGARAPRIQPLVWVVLTKLQNSLARSNRSAERRGFYGAEGKDPLAEPLVDYNLFISSAKLGAAFGQALPSVPSAPWFNLQRRELGEPARVAADAWLKRRVEGARRLMERRADATRFLAIKARLANQLAEALARGRANANRAHELYYNRCVAYEYLRRRGIKSKALSTDMQAAQEDLSRLGTNAVATQVMRQMAREWLSARSRGVMDAYNEQCRVAEELREMAKKVFAQQQLRFRDAELLKQTAAKTAVHGPKRDACQFLMSKLGEAAIARVYRTQNAFESLLARATACIAHCDNQDRAKTWLRSRVGGLRHVDENRDEANGWLVAVGKHAKKTAVAQARARTWLVLQKDNLQRAQVIQKQGLAKKELASAIQQAKDKALGDKLRKKFPRRFAELEKLVRAEEKKVVKDRQKMSLEERVELVVTDVFNQYDVDASGEIDRTEFVAMMRNGLLLGLSEPPKRAALKDAFTQIDIGRDGTVEFSEFYKWFTHARAKGKEGAKVAPSLESIVPAKERALTRMLKEYRSGALALDAEDLKPPPPKKLEGAASIRRPLAELESTDKDRGSLDDRLKAKLEAKDSGPQVVDSRGRVEEKAEKEDTVKKALMERREQEMRGENDRASDALLSDAKRVFALIDVDGSGKLATEEILRAIREDERVADFLKTTPNKLLQYFLVPAKVAVAMAEADADGDGEISVDEWDALIQKALMAKLDIMGGRRVEDDAFAESFLALANQIYDIIDADGDENLDKQEMVKAVQHDEDVIEFLVMCKVTELQDLLVPSKLSRALDDIDADKDGIIQKREWMESIDRALKACLAARAEEREDDDRFSIEFLSLAREVFQLIDTDGSASLDKDEIVRGVEVNGDVQKFLISCGNQYLQYLLVPARVKAMLWELDTDHDESISLEEWDAAIDSALKTKLDARRAGRERDRKAAVDEQLQAALKVNAKTLEMAKLGKKPAGGWPTMGKDGNVRGGESREQLLGLTPEQLAEQARLEKEALKAAFVARPKNAKGIAISDRRSRLCIVM
ncbi:hypothetical protein SO694_00006335 [Aureococcus anophagefferens]|uniref:EF-hand domain-containing protein n=1 Tax=Aureococcus anophagefferens TaxID=44056 RepID=A0ABR1GAI6_AURAN